MSMYSHFPSHGMMPPMMGPSPMGPGMMPPPGMPGAYGPPPGMPGGYGPPPGMPGGYGPPPGYPQPGFGEPMGFLPIFSPISKLVGSIFGRPRPAAAPAASAGFPPLPELFAQNRPRFCQTFCPPATPAPSPGGGRRRLRRRRLGEFAGW